MVAEGGSDLGDERHACKATKEMKAEERGDPPHPPQELSPLPSPEGLVGSGACDQDQEWCGLDENITAEALSRASASPLSGGRQEGSEKKSADNPKPFVASGNLQEGRSDRKLSEQSKENTEIVGEEEAKSSGPRILDEQTNEVVRKAKDQAKRLTLEVARLRSSLRACTSELNLERSNRVRLEDEWWKNVREWEEERDGLVTAKQEAERVSRSADEEMTRVLAQDKAREAKAASELVARETAQQKADGVMKCVVKAQDRLIGALQAEVGMTNRAREAAENDAREAKDQLRLYVKDFLLWRDRAKQLEARMVQLGHPQQPAGVEGDDPEPVATSTGSADAGSTQADTEAEAVTVLSIPENYARYFGTTRTSAVLSDPQEPQEPKEEQGAAAVAAAAVAWSTRSVIAGSSSASSRAHFERSMAAQQAISERLEKDLATARADLQSIYAGSRTKGGGGKALGPGVLPGKEERFGATLSEGVLDDANGDAEGGNPDNQTPPGNQIGEDKGSGGASVEDQAGEAVDGSVAGGPYMARVLAALLGGESTAETEVGRAPSQSLRLADFPPALHAVFGKGQAPATFLPLPATAGRAPGEEGAHRRCGETLTRQQARSRSRRSISAERRERRQTRGNPAGVVGEAQVGFAGKAAISGGSNTASTAACPATSTIDHQACVGGGGGREAGRWEQGLDSGAGAGTASDRAVGGAESRSLTGAFRGYEAKSPLLQRWLVERAAPSVAQSDDVDSYADTCPSHTDSARRGFG